MNKLFIYFAFIMFISLVYAETETQPDIDLLSSTNVDERVFNIRIETNINSTCKYSTRDINFSEMSNEFSSENNLRHSVSQRIQDEGNYDYFIACVNNLNETLITYKEIRIRVNFGDDQEVSFRPISTRTSEDSNSNVISRRWSYPERNKVYDWKIDLAHFSINEIRFLSLTNNEIELRLTKLNNEPIQRYRKEKIVYDYFAIEQNDGVNLKDINIKFKIPLNWFKINVVEKEEITLFRFSEERDGWIKFKTNYYKRDSQNYYFESSIDQFGFFAISFDEIDVKEEEIKNETNESNENNLTTLNETELQNETLKNITINETLINTSLKNQSFDDDNKSKNDDHDYLLSLMEENDSETKDYEIDYPNNNQKILWISIIVLFTSILFSIILFQKLINNKNKKNDITKNRNDKQETNEQNYLEILNKYKDKINNENKEVDIEKKENNENNEKNEENDNKNLNNEDKKIKENFDKEIFNDTLNSPEYFENQLEKSFEEIKEISKKQKEIKEKKKKPFELTDEFIIKKYIKASFMNNMSKENILKSLVDKGYKKEDIVKLIDKIKHQIELNNRLSNVADKLNKMIKNEK